MNTYDINYYETYLGCYTVKANSEEEAEEIFRSKLMHGECDPPEQCLDSKCEVNRREI